MAAARPGRLDAGVTRVGLPLLGYALLALAWTWCVWGPAPQVVPNGDGGNVASMAAGWLERSRFAEDPVLATPDASRFYMALTVPLTMLLGRILNDVGSGYIVQIAPLLFVQLAGFHLLGLRLFGRAAPAAALALLTIPPVLVFPGELWGMLPAPLTRSFAGAALPWVLRLLLGSADGRRASPYAVMAACGAIVYLHPVSAPALAAGCWLALLADRAADTGWTTHLRRMAAAAALFALIAMPFALVFAHALPGGAASAVGNESVVSESLRAAADALYFDVRLVIQALAHDSLSRRWPLWIAGLVALLAVPWIDPRTRRPMRLIAWFLGGIVASSLGLAALDQGIAAATGGEPVQLDLVRNIRFAVPLLMMLFVWLVSAVAIGRTPGRLRHATVLVGLSVLVVYWWNLHPTPVSRSIAAALGPSPRPAVTGENEARLLNRLRELPEHSRMLPVAASRHGYAPIEMLGLAVRYAAWQPVVFLQKDGNLLSYSRSGGAAQWLRALPDTTALRDAGPPESEAILARILARLRPDYLIVHDTITPPQLLPTLVGAGPTVFAEGPWRVVAVSATARTRAQGR